MCCRTRGARGQDKGSRTSTRFPLLVLPLGMLVVSLGCGSSSPSSSSPTAPSTNPSTLNITLQDSPFSDATALLVTFSAVSAHLTGGPFMTLPFVSNATTRTCDLKRLMAAQDVLGTGPMPPGHYTQLRLEVASAILYFDQASSGSPCATTMAAPAGRSAPVEIPSADIRLNREFDVTSTTATTILLDFDGDQSVTQTGNGEYRMNPVITVVSVH